MMKVLRAQSGFEYIITYSWAIVLALLASALAFLFLSYPSTVVPSACTFADGAYCKEIVLGTNTVTQTTRIALLLDNVQNYPMVDPVMNVSINNVNTSATCSPNYVIRGGTILCVIDLPQATPLGQLVIGNLYLTANYCGVSSAYLSGGNCSDAQRQTYFGNFHAHAESAVSPNVTITLTAASGTETADNTHDQLYAVVKMLGYPLSGATVNFTENVSAYTIAPNLTTSDNSGTALSEIWGTTPGLVKVTATYAGINASTIILFTLTPIAPPGGFSQTSNNLYDLFVVSPQQVVLRVNVITDNFIPIQVGGNPKAIVISPDVKYAYVASHASGGSGKAVYEVEINTGNVVNSISNLDNSPADLAMFDSRIYVTMDSNHAISTIDAKTNNVIKNTHVTGTPGGIAITPDGAYVYVALGNINKVAIMNTTDYSIVYRSVDSTPTAVVVSHDGRFVYVSNSGSDDVSVIDTTKNSIVVDSIAVGSGPMGMAISPNGPDLYVVNSNDGTVSVINTYDDMEVTKVILPSSSPPPNPVAVGVSTDGTRLLITDKGNKQIDVFDIQYSYRFNKSISISHYGSDSPFGIATRP